MPDLWRKLAEYRQKGDYDDSRNLLLITIYSLIFLLIRLFCSLESFTMDEAKQLFDSQHFHLGYTDQPPLFSWILRFTSLFIGLNIPMMILVTHALILAIFISSYLICRKIWNASQSLIIVSSLVFFFLYSYDFYRYMIHSILITMIAAWALLTYLKILEKSNIANYVSLGVSFGAGILAKYNFVFFIFTMVLASLSFKNGRKTIFSWKAIISLIVMALILSPHLFWLYQNDFATVHYAMERSEAGTEKINLIKILFDAYWNHLVYICMFSIFFAKSLYTKNEIPQNQSLIALRRVAIAGFLLPLLVIFGLSTGNFVNRWLSPLFLTFALGLFTLVDFSKFKKSKQYFYTVTSIILIIYGIKIIGNFFPDLAGINFIHKPYRAIYAELEPKLQNHKFISASITELPIYSYKEQNVIAGVKLFYPRANLYRLSEIKSLSEPQSILIWDSDKFRTKKIVKQLKQNHYKVEKIFKIKANYIYSKKNKYRIVIAKIIRN